MKTPNYLMIILLLLCVSCSKDYNDVEPNNNLIEIKIDLTTPATRAIEAEPTPKRFVVEVYKNRDQSITLYHTEQSSGNITLRLPKGEYDFYFWADMGPDYYNAGDLRRVKIVEAYTPSVNRVCYAGEQIGHIVAENFPPISASLTRPVARINYINTGTHTEGQDVEFAYKSIATSYSVISKICSDIKDIHVYTKYKSNNATDPFAADYLFPTSTNAFDVDVTMGGIVKMLRIIPLKVNNQTNITAKFN